jgi:acyl-CoA reductase-like NAD-dependent aldehyde dehydrogenase
MLGNDEEAATATSVGSADTSLIKKNFNREYFAVVQGGIPETTEVLAQKFDEIFLTGSVPVGKVVYGRGQASDACNTRIAGERMETCGSPTKLKPFMFCW